MAKSRKRKVGLQKKVSSVFEGVTIPQADDIVQTPRKSTSDDSRVARSKPTTKDSLVSKSSLMMKVRQSESSLDKDVKKTKKTVVSKRTASGLSASKDSTTQKSRRAKDKPEKTIKKTTKTVVSKQTASVPSASKKSTTRKTRRAKDESDKAVKKTKKTVLSKQTASVSSASKDSTTQKSRRAKDKPEKTIKKTKKTVVSKRTVSAPSASKDSTTRKTRQAEDKPDKATIGRTTDPLSKLTVLDRLIPHRSSAKKSPKAKDSTDSATPDRTFRVPPKLTVPDDLILQRAPVNEPLQTENTSDKPDRTVEALPKQTLPDHPVQQQLPVEETPKAEDVSDKVTPDRTVENLLKQILQDHPVQHQPPVEETSKAEDVLDKVTPDRTVEGLPKQTVPADHAVQHQPPEKATPKAKDTSNKVTPDLTVSIPFWMKSPDDADSRNSLMVEPKPSEESLSKIESNITVEDFQIDEDESRPKHPLAEKSRQIQKTSDKAGPNKKSWVPPKLTIPGHPIAQVSSTKAPKSTEDVQGKTEPDRMKVAPPQRQSIAREPASLNSLVKKPHQAKDKPDMSAMNATAEVPSTLKSMNLQRSLDTGSDKRYGPEAPARKAKSFEQQEIPVFEKQSGPSLWQQINNKLFAPQSGVSHARQKIMVVSIPILAIIMIFILRQVLSKSPRNTKGNTVEETTLIVEADPSHEINWQIPEPIPATMRDPTILPVENDTQNEEQNHTVDIPKRELVKIGSIVYSKDKSSAIVNGRIVHVGDTVSGVTILGINRDSVELEKDGEKWTQNKYN